MAPKRKATRALESSKSKKSSPTTTKDVQKLGNEIQTESKYNNFVILINQLRDIKVKLITEEDSELESLGRQILVVVMQNFKTLFEDGKLTKTKNQDDHTRLVVNWVLEKYDNSKTILMDILKTKLSFDSSLQLDVLDILFDLLKIGSEYNKSEKFPTKTYQSIIESLLNSSNGEILSDGSSNNFILLEFIDSFFNKYWDLQFYFFNNLSSILENWKNDLSEFKLQKVFANFLTIIRKESLFNSNEEELKSIPTWLPKSNLSSSIYKINLFKSQFQKTVITILSFPLTIPQYKSILLILQKRIIPYMSQPQGLMDFLTDLYNLEDTTTTLEESISEDSDNLIIPILTLNSLYELIKNYNLEYPDFYTKLYSLLNSNLFYTKYRSRFIGLVDLFLSSTHLSSNLVASFIKKLARLSLTASASGVVIIIPFIYNLLKRHPTCMIMIHNTNENDTKEEILNDPFNNQEKNPMNTKAINSSLWELEILMNHYHPNIATLAKIFKEPFKKPNYNLEDFLDWSYLKLLETEQSRKFKLQTTALEFEEFSNILNDKDNIFKNNEVNENILLEGWSL